VQREYGYAPRGQPVYDTKQGSRSPRTNGIGGRGNGQHSAIEQYKHTTNAAFFEHWFSERLLKDVPSGCTIIMDNASFHRKNALLELMEESKREIKLLLLPAYSPDLNPIEQLWANMKRFLKSYLHTFPDLHCAISAFFQLE